MARKKKGRLINGILILDKPSGITSNAALQKVKRLFDAQKAGHTGSLDPLASGVLPICLGEATKLSHYLLAANKRYRARCVLGVTTTTGDAEGEILARKHVPRLDEPGLLAMLEDFKGPQLQTPPMYSALKHNGRPLYEYARNGIEIERKSREITIFELNLLDFKWFSDTWQGQNNNRNNNINNNISYIEIEVLCSKGTYIRSLCEDIGSALGCGAHIAELRRLEAEPFDLSQAVSLESLAALEDLTQRDLLLLPVDSAIVNFPQVQLSSEQKQHIEQGHEIDFNARNKYDTVNSIFRLYFNNTLIALAIPDQNGHLKPKRLLFL